MRNWIWLAVCAGFVPQAAHAVGGCGCSHGTSVVGAVDSGTTSAGALRFTLYNELGKYGTFVAGGEEVDDPRKREATINATTLSISYGVLDRVSVGVQIPYVQKFQEIGDPPPSPKGMFPTNPKGGEWSDMQITNFQENVRPALESREAVGLGDVSAGVQVEVLPQAMRDEGFFVAASLGARFPTGSIEEGDPRLPQPFQAGSGQFELLPGVAFSKTFGGSVTWYELLSMRLPLGENDAGYDFGDEYTLVSGAMYGLPFWDRRLRVGAQIDLNLIQSDHVDAERNYPDDGVGGERVVPVAQVASDGEVTNTGGLFLYAGPSIEVEPTDQVTLGLTTSFALVADGNGDPNHKNAKGGAAPLGQVIADVIFGARLTVGIN